MRDGLPMIQGSANGGRPQPTRVDSLARAKMSGFSLIEMLIVVSLMMIAAVIVIENVQSAVQSVHLQETATDYANLLQQARVRAVRDDRYYTVLTTAGGGSNPPTAFVDIAGTGVYAVGDPVIMFSAGVSPMSFGSGPSVANLASQFLPPGTAAQNSVNTTAAGPTFGPRGLPCTPLTSGGYTTCPYLTPTSYITFVQNTLSGKWEAITVSPAGRIREFSYDGVSTWSGMN